MIWIYSVRCCSRSTLGVSPLSDENPRSRQFQVSKRSSCSHKRHAENDICSHLFTSIHYHVGWWICGDISDILVSLPTSAHSIHNPPTAQEMEVVKLQEPGNATARLSLPCLFPKENCFNYLGPSNHNRSERSPLFVLALAFMAESTCVFVRSSHISTVVFGMAWRCFEHDLPTVQSQDPV